MRVLHIGKFFPPHAGGIERFSADLCAALAARDIDVAMLAHASPADGNAKHFRESNVDVHLAACHGQWLYAPVSPSFPFVLTRLIGEFQPDLLHLHLPNTSAFWALLEQIDALLPEHRAWLEEHYATGTFVASGRLVPRTGGVILAHGIARDELKQILATDPFDALRSYTITEFVPTLVAPGLESIAEQLP